MPVVGEKFINVYTKDAVDAALEPNKVLGVFKKGCKKGQERDRIEQY